MAKNKDKGDGPTKAERKALEKREAAIVAELDARGSKPVKPKGKKAPAPVGPDVSGLKRKALKALIADKTNGKLLRNAAKAELAERDNEPALPPAHASKTAKTGKPKSKVKPDPADDKPVKPTPPAMADTKLEAALHGTDSHREVTLEDADNAERIATLEGIIADLENNSQETRDKAKRNLAKLRGESPSGLNIEPADETDEQIKARVKAKKLTRAELEATAEGIDRDDQAAVDAYNAAMAELGGAHFITGTAELEKAAKAGKRKLGPDELAVTIDGETLAEPKAQTVEEVETERGRVFAAGETDDEPVAAKVDPAVERGFALPSEAPTGPPDFETNGNGQYKIKRLSDGKIVGYTRATTYIGTNEDRTLLEKWKMRILLEGVALNDTPEAGDETVSEPVVAKVRDFIHVRDLAIAKARKQDAKGKLVPGQYGTIVDAAWSAFKRELDALGEELLELGGVHVKAAKGTELHELTELYDREGIDAVGELLEAGKITHADMLDVEAYARAIERAGIKMVLIEQPIVVERIKVAGRLDRVVMCKLPGAARAAKYILDTKTGRIDLGAGKIAQQLEVYSEGETYDLETHERGKHGASRTKGLVLHLVPGSAEAHIYVVDLSTGRVGNELSAKVRAYRNEGKKAIDMTVDLAAPVVA